MEQRFKEQSSTDSKQYGPKFEMIFSGVLFAVVSTLLVVASLI